MSSLEFHTPQPEPEAAPAPTPKPVAAEPVKKAIKPATGKWKPYHLGK